MKNLPRNAQGFALAEVLVSSVVVAAAGALLAGALAAANRGADRRIEQILTTQLLAGQLALLDDRVGDATPKSGTFQTPTEEGFLWTLQMEDAGTPLSPLAKVTLTVTRKDHAAHVVTCRPRAQQH